MDTTPFCIIQTALGGLGIFLLGMRFMSDGLQALAGQRLNRLISAVTDNKFLAVLVGIGVTCVIQSSSATTVMVVGFVNSGMMTLLQGIGVIYGANIGTTLSLWLLTLDVSKYGDLFIGVSVFMYLFSRKEKFRSIGMALLGLGMLFFGLTLMSRGFAPLREVEGVRNALSFFQASSTIGFIEAVLVGAFITGIIQSSAATIVIVMGLAGAGMIDFPTVVALVLGSNIGTTITAMLACIGANRNALRAALAHTFFNIIGVVGVTLIWRQFVSGCENFIVWARPELAEKAVSDVSAMTAYYTFAISCVHTAFNLSATIILFPFMSMFAKVVTRIIPVRASEHEQKGYKSRYLDPHMIPQTAVALGQAQKEILLMGDCCLSMLERFRDIITSDTPDEEKEEYIFHMEENMDVAQKEISEYIGRILHDNVSRFLSDLARRELRQADEFESVSDYIRQALKSYKKIHNAGEELTPTARAEVVDLANRIDHFLRVVKDIIIKGDKNNILLAVEEYKETEKAAKSARDAHMQRLGVSCTSPVKSLIYSDLLVSFRRQGDHLLNIAQTLDV